MELLVVIVIIAIVSSIGANNFKSQRSQVRYNDSILKVTSLIKTARNYAVTSRTYWDKVNSKNVVAPEGYGVYIEQRDTPGESKVILFANTYDPLTDSEEDRNQYDANDLIEEEYILPIEIDFIGISVDKLTPVHTPIGGTSGDDEVVIIFRPPLATASLAVNDNPLPDQLVPLNDLYLEFERSGSLEGIPSKYIHMGKVAGFPELE